MANRVWQGHFGVGLVRTLIRDGRSLKALHRIVREILAP
jgi:hypothetical protein